MIELRDRRRLITELIVAELLARPGRPGPLARPRWRWAVPRPVPAPAAPPAAPAPDDARSGQAGDR